MSPADFIIRIGLNSTGFTQGANKATSDLNSFALKLDSFVGKASKIGSAITAGFEAFAIGKLFLKINDGLDKLIEKAKNIKVGSTRSGLDTTTFQQVSNVADAKGSSPERIETAIEKTADAMQAIRDGADDGAKLQTAMARLGVTLDDIKKKNHQQVFFEIAENMKAVELTTERLAAFRDIFGKGSGELIPVLKEGFSGKVANRGILEEDEVKKLLELKKLGKEAAEPWENVGKVIALEFGKIKIGLLSAPGIIGGYFGRLFGGEGEGGGEAHANDMQRRIAEHQMQKAEAEAAKAAEKKKKDEVAKHAKEIAGRMAEETKRAAREEVESASPANRRRILRERNQAINSQISNIDTAIRVNGDPDGSLALRRLELVNQRSENRRGIQSANVRGVSLLPEGASDRTRIGLFTGRQGGSERIFQQQLTTMQQQLSAANEAVRELQSLRQDIND